MVEPQTWHCNSWPQSLFVHIRVVGLIYIFPLFSLQMPVRFDLSIIIYLCCRMNASIIFRKVQIVGLLRCGGYTLYCHVQTNGRISTADVAVGPGTYIPPLDLSPKITHLDILILTYSNIRLARLFGLGFCCYLLYVCNTTYGHNLFRKTGKLLRTIHS